MKLIKQNELRGIEVFEMKGDGCINGQWIDNRCNGKMFNEIAKIQKEAKNFFEGKYTSRYTEIKSVAQDFVKAIKSSL